jgi:hypothetical protein
MKNLIEQSRQIILNEAPGKTVFVLFYEPSDGRTRYMGVFSSEKIKKEQKDAKDGGWGPYHNSDFEIRKVAVQ